MVLKENKETPNQQQPISPSSTYFRPIITFSAGAKDSLTPLTVPMKPEVQNNLDTTISNCSSPAEPVKNNRTLSTEKTGPISNKPNISPLLLKKHHLFITEQEAELSINTGKLNKSEQQQLLQRIKHHLQQQKINLKQLIINGVPYE